MGVSVKERSFHGVIVKTTLRSDKINMHKFNNSSIVIIPMMLQKFILILLLNWNERLFLHGDEAFQLPYIRLVNGENQLHSSGVDRGIRVIFCPLQTNSHFLLRNPIFSNNYWSG